jgi:hypothetical protein
MCEPTIMQCPEIESGAFLCDREARYQINGSRLCHLHARRLQDPNKIYKGTIDSSYSQREIEFDRTLREKREKENDFQFR